MVLPPMSPPSDVHLPQVLCPIPQGRWMGVEEDLIEAHVFINHVCVFDYVNEYFCVSLCVFSLPAVPHLLLCPGLAGAASGLGQVREGSWLGILPYLAGQGMPTQQVECEQQPH